ncbi:hypothetical protein DVS77_29840 [Mycolicibacterium moriokaense]|nr:hypothetical protein DVS77_29840 [Mycolicibacterium moriokaense]
MTTTSDTGFHTATIAAAAYYDERDDYTVAQAWSSSALGDIGGDVGYDEPTTAISERRDRSASRAKLFAALAAGVIGGATLGAVLFGWAEPAKPTAIVPDAGVSTSPLPSAATPPSGPQAPAPVTVARPAPKPAAPVIAPKTATPAPAAAVAPAPLPVAVPPAAPPPVVIDVQIPTLPPLGEKPEPPAPEPPQPPTPPEPPKFNPPDIKIAQVPQVDPPPDPKPLDKLAPVVKP